MSGYGYYPMMGYGHDWSSMGGMMIFGGLIWLVLLVLAVVAIVWVVRSTVHVPHAGLHPPQRSPGLDILEERYARGEIGREEYFEKKADLLGQEPAIRKK